MSDLDLSAVKVGDELATLDGNNVTNVIVSRVTKTQIVVTYSARVAEEKFRRSDGCKVGGSEWHPTRLVARDDPRVEKLRDARKRQKMANDIDKALSVWVRNNDIGGAVKAHAILKAYLKEIGIEA